MDSNTINNTERTSLRSDSVASILTDRIRYFPASVTGNAILSCPFQREDRFSLGIEYSKNAVRNPEDRCCLHCHFIFRTPLIPKTSKSLGPVEYTILLGHRNSLFLSKTCTFLFVNLLMKFVGYVILIYILYV